MLSSMPWLEREYLASAYAWISGGTPTTAYTRRGGYVRVSGCVLTAEAAGVAIGFSNQLDWIARSDRPAPDYPRHLTGTAGESLEGIDVYFEHLPARWAIAGDLQLGIANAQVGAIRELHDLHAFDG